LLLAAAVAASLGLSVTPASATKTHLFVETFGSADQQVFKSANALAVDRSSGDLLVIDASAKTLTRYNPDGTPADFSALGTNTIDAKGTGQCATVPADCDQTPQNGFTFSAAGPGEQQIAVDNSGTATDGNIYVTQGLQEAGNLVDIFASSGKYLGQLTAAGAAKFGSTGFPFSPCGVAVDGAGSVYLAAGFENRIYKFDPSANPPLNTDNTATFPLSEPVCNLAAGAGPTAGSLFVNTYLETTGNSVLKLDSAGGAVQAVVDPGVDRLIAVDPLTGHLYAAGGNVTVNNSVEVDKLKEFDASGTGGNLLSITPIIEPRGLAIDGPTSRVYAPTVNGSNISVYGPLVTVPDVTTGAAAITGDTSTRLNGTVNPDGVALEECFFEYGLTNAYGQTAPCAESPAEIGTGTKAVHADLSGLDAETLYHFRLAAKNPNATIRGKDGTFKTPSKPAIKGQWSAEVGIAEATLKAHLNPENSPTTYRFEWGTDTSYGSATAEIPIGSGEADRTVGFYLDGLAPGTTYHYRVVASNGIGTTEGSDHAFTTFPTAAEPKSDCPNQAFRTGPSALLPDCRAYEMVSPVDKNGGEIKVLGSFQNFRSRLEESSADGNRFAYSSITAFGDALSAPWTSEYVATRKEGEGWSTHAISPPRETTSSTHIPTYIKLDLQYKLFSSDLSSSWLIHDTEPPLDSCAPAGGINLNLYRRDNNTGEYEALTTVEPTDIGTIGYELELQGVSADETHAIIRANGKLTPDAATKGLNQLYEHVRDPEGGCGELRLVSVLPDGKANSTGDASMGGRFLGLPGETRVSVVSHALSADGSLAFWSVAGAALYVRDMEAGKTVQIAAGSPQFWNATPDGSKALYSAGGSLYEFDTAKGLAGEPASTPVAAAFEGLVATSEDMSRVYFLSSEAIGGEGEAGERNLYLREGGEKIFIATLPDSTIGAYRYQDGSISQYDFGVGGPVSNGNGVRATVDGSHLAFVSPGELTGYDNTDASGDGLRDLEVYLYDAGTDHLACISCNPSGSRPEGRLFSNNGSPEVRRVSAHMAPGQNQFFAPRTLSADGNRLFFDSFEALLPRDTNGKGDVYEWQRAGSQSECDEMGAELYVPSSGGCLSLISSGQSPSDSEFADASPGGSDVFIRTSSSLLPQDPGQVDLYDARIGGGLPQRVGPPAACEGEACQGPLAPPNDPTPASSAFEGAGNVVEAPAKKRKKAHKAKQRKKSHKQAKHKRRVGAR
jgi:hypothetical protein